MAEKMAPKVITGKKFVRGSEAGRGKSLGLFPPNTVDTKDRFAGRRGALLETILFLSWIVVQVTAHSN